MDVIRKAILIFQLFQSCQLVIAESNVLTGQLAHFVGEDINLPCSCLLKDYVSWDLSPVGTKSPVIIHAATFGITGEYKSGKRHSVTLNETSRTCDLAIVNITVGDAGAYTCTVRNRNRTEYELIVLESSPTCSSNISLAGTLIENDCNIDPDYIELNCTVSYHGNLAPVLQWRQSNKDDVISSSVHQSRSSSALQTTHRLTFRSDIKQNGSHFECLLKDNVTPIQRQLCATQRISVSYFFKTSETRTVEEIVGDLENVTCSANTSEVCSYRWLATNVSTNSTIQITTQSSIPKYLKIYHNSQCVAECRIRNKSCTVQPLELRLEIPPIHDKVVDEHLVYKVVIPIIVVVVCFILGIAVFLIIRIRGESRRKYGIDSQELKPLNNPSEEDVSFPKLRSPPNQLLEELVKRRIITHRQKKHILKEQRHPPSKDKYEIIRKKMFQKLQSKFHSELLKYVSIVKEIDDFYCLGVNDDQTTIPYAKENTEVAGIAYLNNTLFVVCFHSSEAMMFENLMTPEKLNPNVREEENWKRLTLNVGEHTLNDPYGMTACTKYNSIFILEGRTTPDLWKIKISAQTNVGKKLAETDAGTKMVETDAGTILISRCGISGEGRGLSINSSDQLVVLVLSPYGGMLVKIYDPSTLKLESSINLISLISNEAVFHIYPTSENHFLLFQQENKDGLFIVKEVSFDGKDVVKKFDPSKNAELNWRDFSVGMDNTYAIRDIKDAGNVFESGVWYDEDPYERRYWYPDHLLVGDNGHVFVVDKTRKGVLLMNKHSLSPRELISGKRINGEFPSRVCYIREHQLLIVGHISSFKSDGSPSISIFKFKE